jgi:[protein-PII] uridylyltransferase
VAVAAEHSPGRTANRREAWNAGKRALLAGRKPTGNPQPILTATARLADDMIRSLWADLDMPKALALIAVGGYGRAELFPHSDIDLLVLLPRDADAKTAEAVERFVGALWDMGMEIGHSVRTIEECLAEARADISVQTSLLESRRLAGNAALCLRMNAAVRKDLDRIGFMRAKLLEMRQRHLKFEDTPYALEPNVKEGPGGLRDLQVILWISKAAGLGDSFSDLARAGVITSQEAGRLQRNERFLKRVRLALHDIAHRREDRLVFDLQTQLALYFGFKTDSHRRVSEFLMQAYYWAARAVTQLSKVALQNLELRIIAAPPAQPVVISNEFLIRDGLLDLADPEVFKRRPAAILDVFHELARHPEAKDFSAGLLSALESSRKLIDARFRRDPENRARFMALLRLEDGVTHVFRRLNATGVLGRYLPVFRRIVGQMQHDLFHIYTVDQHILTVLRNVRRFAIPEHAHEYPFCSQLIASFERPWLLYIAALFHDIAKGRGGDHSVLGMADARRFCRDHGLSREDTRLVVFLVEHHLTMSKTAQKMDITDPQVVGEFTRLVKDERRLTALYLLTVADIRGTSPKVWNSWKGKLLEDLYRASLRQLGGKRIDTQTELAARRAEAQRLLRLHTLPEGAEDSLWKRLDVAFFVRNGPADIAWMTRMLLGKEDHPDGVVRARIAPGGVGLQVMVYVPDQPDLFARTCGFFNEAGFSILDARVHTTRSGHALDTFVVHDETRAEHYRDIISLLEHELSARLAQRPPLAPPVLGRLSRKSRVFPIPPIVDLRPDEKGLVGTLSLTAADRNGLLYTVTYLLSQYRANVRMAKIATLGERVEDTFLIDGPIMSDPKQQIQLEKALLDALAS